VDFLKLLKQREYSRKNIVDCQYPLSAKGEERVVERSDDRVSKRRSG
jgi:hypothetical protein